MAAEAPTRRAMLGAIAALSFVAAPVAVAATAPVASSDFQKLLAVHRSAAAVAAKFETSVYKPAVFAYEAAIAAIPHAEVIWPTATNPRDKVWSTANTQMVREYRYFLANKHKDGCQPSRESFEQTCVKFVAAADERDRLIVQARVNSGIQAIELDLEKLEEIAWDARDAVILCPVHSAADLAAKLAFIDEHDQWEYEDTRRVIAEDAKRLAVP